MWELNEDCIVRMSQRLDRCRQLYDEKNGRHISFNANGDGKTWVGVEADEVDLGKDLVLEEGKVT